MSGFKLLAIIPLQGCETKYRKNLKIGDKYLFYNNYDVELNENFSSIISVKENKELPQVPDKLFYLNNGIKLSISAVVGKNGTGKSTLFELLYYLIYIISINQKIKNKPILEPKSKSVENQLSELKRDYRVEKIYSVLDDEDRELALYQLIKKYKLYNLTETTIEKKNLRSQIIKGIQNKKIDLEHQLKLEQKNEVDLENGLAISLLYKKGNCIYEVSYRDKNLTYNQFDENGKKNLTTNDLDLKSLFYSISINYSIHSLNSNTLGNWVSKLFHKNDAYVTPVVINPMRDEGNFDINKELHLSKERLMTNVVYDIVNEKDSLILDKYRVKRFIFNIKKKYRFPYPIPYGDDLFYENEIVGKLLKSKIKLTTSEKLTQTLHGYALTYIDKKIDKIRDQYGFLIYNGESPPLKINEDEILLKFLCEDKSHITKKINQTVNFIKYSIDFPDIWKFNEGESKIIESEKLTKWIEKCVTNPKESLPSELVEIALPGFFNVDFEFIKPEYQEEVITLGSMSSGEQQMILNINSILYHLYNIQSVHKEIGFGANENTDLERVKYSNINIALDEIELYFHPDMQRLLVNNLVKAIEKVKRKGKNGIESINVCFITHSPFILSDIPSQNILRLETDSEGEPIINTNASQTFGANIHDLLANDFFLESGFMGEFAKEKINNLIYYLTSDDETSEGLDMDSIEHYIELIGEPFLKNDLLELFKTKKSKFMSDDEIEKEISRLTKLKRNDFNQ